MLRRFPSTGTNVKLFFEGDELLEFSLERSVQSLDELAELTQTTLSGEFPAVSVSHVDLVAAVVGPRS
eukprot:2498804-Pleurochrysis_carterae.AAC.1